MTKATAPGEPRARDPFELAPISLCEKDYSVVKVCLDRLRAEGVADLPA